MFDFGSPKTHPTRRFRRIKIKIAINDERSVRDYSRFLWLAVGLDSPRSSGTMIAIGSITYSIAHISSHAHVLTESGYITTIPSFQSWLVDDHLPRVAR